MLAAAARRRQVQFEHRADVVPIPGAVEEGRGHHDREVVVGVLALPGAGCRDRVHVDERPEEAHLLLRHACGLQDGVPAVHRHGAEEGPLLDDLPGRVVQQQQTPLADQVQPERREQVPLALAVARAFVDAEPGHRIPHSQILQQPHAGGRLAGGGGAEDQRVPVGERPQAIDRAAGADPDLEQAVLLPDRDLEAIEPVGGERVLGVVPDHVELIVEHDRRAVVADRTGRELCRRIELPDRLDAAEHVVDFGRAARRGAMTDRRRRRAEAALEVVELARERRQVVRLVEHLARQPRDLCRSELAAGHRADDPVGEPAVQVVDRSLGVGRGIGRVRWS